MSPSRKDLTAVGRKRDPKIYRSERSDGEHVHIVGDLIFNGVREKSFCTQVFLLYVQLDTCTYVEGI